jgi:heme-degrading monooxygenase HmoA
MHLVQYNIGRLTAPLDSPQLKDFVDNLAEINGLAERSPGYVWRLTDDGGVAATGLRPYEPDVIVNLSVWESLEHLRAFTYRTVHLSFLRRRREFFRPYPGAYQVLWWIPAGSRPTVAEAMRRLALLESGGPGPAAFTFRQPFPAGDATLMA